MSEPTTQFPPAVPAPAAPAPSGPGALIAPAPARQTGEGEPQTDYIPPAEGGSYVRHADGSLSRMHGPTKIPDTAPVAASPAPVVLPTHAAPKE